MKTSIPYNDYSQELKDLVKWPTDSKGKPVDNVVYMALHKGQLWEWTPDDQRVLTDTHPGILFNGRDTIIDKGNDFASVEIGYYKTLKREGDTVMPTFLPIEFNGKDRGFLYVPHKGGQELFKFMELTNLNKDSVNPEAQRPSIGWLFERVKPEQAAQAQVDKMAETFRVGSIIMQMVEENLRKLAPKLGLNSTMEEALLRHSILLRVQSDPEEVNNLLDSEQVRIEDEIRKALGKKLVEFDPDIQGFVNYATREVLALIPSDAVDKLDSFATFLSSTTGRPVRDKVRNLLSANKNAKQVAVAPDPNFDDDEVPVKKPAKTGKPVAKAGARKPPPGRKKAAAPVAESADILADME